MNIMRKILTISLLFFAILVCAENRTQLITEAMPLCPVVQDSAITRLLDRKVNGVQDSIQLIDGYRVQVYSSNQHQIAKQEAISMEQNLKNKITEPIYVQYVTPFWKVRVGNYRTIQEATTFKNELLQLFPELQVSTYVVRDKVLLQE